MEALFLIKIKKQYFQNKKIVKGIVFFSRNYEFISYTSGLFFSKSELLNINLQF